MDVGKCLAYPKGIPYKFISGEISHIEVFDDQVGNYIYTPKKEYIEHDFKLKEKYIFSLAEYDKLKAEVTQLLYDDLYTRGIIKKNWDKVRVDFELLLNIHGGKFNEVSLFSGASKNNISNIESSEFVKKILFLLRTKANQTKCTRLVLSIYPDSSSSFEFY